MRKIGTLQKLSNFNSLNLFISNVFFAEINDCLRFFFFFNFKPFNCSYNYNTTVTHPIVPDRLISSSTSSEYMVMGELYCFCAILGLPHVVNPTLLRAPFPSSSACTQ